jgi:hypothetical protein
MADAVARAAWITLNHTYGWMDEALKNFDKFVDGVAFQSLFGF